MQRYCVFYATNSCTNGDSCNFSHDYQVPKPSEKQLCVHFLKGKCSYGDKCRQSHVITPKVINVLKRKTFNVKAQEITLQPNQDEEMKQDEEETKQDEYYDDYVSESEEKDSVVLQQMEELDDILCEKDPKQKECRKIWDECSLYEREEEYYETKEDDKMLEELEKWHLYLEQNLFVNNQNC